MEKESNSPNTIQLKGRERVSDWIRWPLGWRVINYGLSALLLIILVFLLGVGFAFFPCPSFVT